MARFTSGRTNNNHHHGHGHGHGHGNNNLKKIRSPNIESELKDLLNAPENSNKCGECGSAYPTWCSLNLGIFLCGRCASVHRKILNNREDDVFSKIKSLSLDRWYDDDIDSFSKLGGNKGNNQFWNPKREPFPFDGDDDKSIVEHFIRDKYIVGKFRYDDVKPEDFGNKDDFDTDHRSYSRRSSYDDTDDYGYSRSTDSSNRGFKYSRQLEELRDMGYNSNISRIKDTLERTHGNINKTIDILERYDSTSSFSRETSHHTTAHSTAPSSSGSGAINNPPLPKRRSTLSGPQPAVFDGSTDIASLVAQQTAAVGAGAAGLVPGSVQQYYDPATGMIYVDQQQYMLAMQLQQQQQQQQQQQHVLQAQLQQQQQAVPQMGMQFQQVPTGLPIIYNGVQIFPNNPQYQQLLMLQQQQQQQQKQQNMGYFQ
ncbi:Gts1p NDAI_0G03440 [Naumovozyma dairenensis CBS 421]|uniref:Arf-GAP domain-containing protein n=1 Tax=Naumovozyma dairenensis (strain ATCC 10597 / BCRC 20456 / CBS 421 / NBRC 0211 / NRRL Y-12639) TaxID=1071378 RepID=G0WEB0_NAUDC|nr:hypothetical protein NDAI_0G03440 [Naumovozyma dairenensis CBS 421]CCD26121.2 hypothetical protein NDAI_0G03440 [Naumovozyma dairenensis CBS 421]